MMGQRPCPYDRMSSNLHKNFEVESMAVGHEFDRASLSNERVLPSWRVVLSAWLVVGFLVLLAVGMQAAAAHFTISSNTAGSAQLVIPRHDPRCDVGVPTAATECSGIDPALMMRYSQF